MAPPTMNLRVKLGTATKRVPKQSLKTSGSEPSASQEKLKTTGQSYRQKLKTENPKAYEAHKRIDAINQKMRRLSMSDEKRKEYNRKTAIRMANMRRRKKEAKAAETAKCRSVKVKPATRAELLKEAEKRKKAAVYKREQRARLTKWQKEEINRRRREKARLEREMLLELRKKRKEQLEHEKLERLKKKELEEKELAETERLVQDELTPKRQPSARRKALSRARASISKDPIIYAETVLDLVDKASPMKRKALQEKLPCTTPLKKRKIDALIADNVKQQLNHLKYSRKSNHRMQRRQLASSLSFLKKYKLLRKGSKMFGVSPKIITRGPCDLKYRNAKKISTATRTKVTNYYEMHSVELPDQKHISKKTLKKTRVLEKPIYLLYGQFKNDFPELKIGASAFFNLRPKHVKTAGSIKFRGCLCEYCENVELKLKILNFNCAIQQETECQIHGVDKAANLTMCDKGTARYNNMQCINRECDQCGSSKVREHLKKLEKTKEVEWFRWESSKEEKLTKTGLKMISRKVRTVKKGTLDKLIDELQEELAPMTHHLFLKYWQQEQFSNLTKQRLPDGWCVMVLDFAENYTCKTQDEVQAAHWTQEQVTVHPIVMYYNCASTCSTTTPIMHCFSIISDDLTHDHHAVHQFTSEAIKYVRQEMASPLTKVIRFSDGCSAQYKSKGPFVDISYAMEDNNVPIQHEYFGSRHGKGPSDGESAVLKRMTSMAESSHQASVTNALEMYKFCHKHLTKGDTVGVSCVHFKRTVVYIPRDNICRDRHREGKTLPGTRRTHSVKTVKAGVVAKRNLTCFCPACVEGVGDCINSVYVDGWQEFQVGSDRNEQAQNTEDPDSAGTTDNTDGNVSSQLATAPKLDYKVGEYVSVIYDDDWWAGEVTDANDNKCHINFMAKKGENKFVWPSPKDAAWVEKTGIFTRLPSPPEPVTNRYMGFDAEVFNSITAAVKNYLKEKR